MEQDPASQVPPAPISSQAASTTASAVGQLEATILCPQCQQPVSSGAVFCPNCGKQLKDKQLSTAAFTQASLYVFAALLPPLGFWPGIKYYRNSDPKAQQVGMALILISIASTIITLWLTFKFLNIYLTTFNSVLNGTGGLN